MSGGKTKAWVSKGKGQPLVQETVDLPPLGDDDVEVKVKYCGICHSDVFIVDGAWGSFWPAVAGHEIVGEITQVGKSVSHLKAGQIVGIGWQKNSCHHCYECNQGKEHLCTSKSATCMGNIGGFADYHRTNSKFAIPIPSGLSLESVGPLMCGGITTFTPFVDFDVKPYHRIAVFGIGGLGHLALKWGVKWGCEVTAFSTTANKEKEVKGFGSHNFVVYKDNQISDAKQKEEFNRYFDLILVTVPHPIDVNFLLSLLKGDGRLCYVASAGDLSFNGSSIWLGATRHVSGSNTGSVPGLHLMLQFAARHEIVPTIEVFSQDKINEGMDKVRNNSVRYRAVVDFTKSH